MNSFKQKSQVIIPAGRKPWPHELHVANILAMAGHTVKFIPEKPNTKTADIYLDDKKFEIKSPKSANANSLEHILKNALKQSCNIIIDTSRIKNIRDDNIRRFLTNQLHSRKQIKKLILITKQGKIIDINSTI